MLKKRDRLTTKDIAELSFGKSVFGTLLSLRFVPAKRIGFAVAPAKKVFSTAVERVKARRRVYSAIEKLIPEIKTPIHAMVMPKKECLTVPFNELCSEIGAVFSKARLLN